MREHAVAVALALGGCVLPADDPTGLELSWIFLEGNRVDGDDALRARTCAGFGIDRIAVDLADQDDPTRQGTFRFPCELGYQTQADLQIESSDAFVELHGGTYDVVLGDEENGQDLGSRTVDVDSSGVTIETWELTPPTSTWTIALVAADACGQVTLRLFYDDPEAMLAEPSLDEDDEPVETIYREALASDRGLRVGGTPTPCAAELAGTHTFADVDRGAYRLEVDVDGLVCALPVEIDADGVQTALDLANLPCAG